MFFRKAVSLAGGGALLLALAVLPNEAAAAEPPDVRIQLVAVRKPVLAAEIAARIIRADLRGGSAFERDAVLIGFDCSLYKAREARARSQREKVFVQSEALKQLERKGATSPLEVSMVAAEVASAEAELRLAEISVQRCEIRASFKGRVAELRVQVGEYVAEGQPVIEILDDGQFEVEAIVPSAFLAKLESEHPFTTRFDELGVELPAKVVRVSPLIDPVSQTVKIYGRLTSLHPKLTTGMSGIGRFTGLEGGPR